MVYGSDFVGSGRCLILQSEQKRVGCMMDFGNQALRSKRSDAGILYRDNDGGKSMPALVRASALVGFRMDKYCVTRLFRLY